MQSDANESFVLLDNAKDISKKREHVLSQYKALKDALASRRVELVGILRLQHFYRDANELEKWIAERMQRASEESWKTAVNLEVCLQKHKTLAAEVHANQGSLAKLQKEGNDLIADDHHAKEILKTRLSELNCQWEELLKALVIQGRYLDLAHELSVYIRWCDEILYWIKDKETLVLSEEYGHDLEHVEILQAKHNELVSELQGYGERVKEVNEKAEKMIEIDDHDIPVIQAKQNDVNEAWSRLNKQANKRHKGLIAAFHVHKFKKNAVEVISWMKEKEIMMHPNDLGNDVASVQRLQRHHETIEYDMIALKDKVDNLCLEAERIESEYENASVEDEKRDILNNWEKLNKMAEEKKLLLRKQYDLHHFQSECKELMAWCKMMKSRLTADELASDVASAEILVDKHQENMGEIKAQQDNFEEVFDSGKKLLSDEKLTVKDDSSSSQSSSSSDSESDEESRDNTVSKKLLTLESQRKELLEIWEERQALYDQCLHLALFNRDAEQAESWMTAQEALLTQQDLGDSLDSVQTLKRKHDDLCKSAAAQEEKINSVDEVAARLIDRGHYAAEEIDERRNALLARHAAQKQASEARRAALDNAYKFYSFLRNLHNLSSWIEEKRAIATDDAYKDEGNAMGKLQRHRLFEEEVNASQERMQSCMDEGRALIESDHYASHEIQTEVDRVQALWEKLLQECRERGEKLSDASKEQAFNRAVSDIDRWIDEVEASLASDDTGKDVASVTSLIKKHQVLEAEVQIHKERVDGIEIQTNKFVEDGHFNCDAIKEKQTNLSERYKKLQEPITARRDRLAASLLSKQLFRDIEDELEWIEEKRPIVSAANLGKNLMSAKNLLKKHELVQSEIAAHQTTIDNVVAQAKKLVDDDHVDGKQAEVRSQELMAAWEKLLSDAAQRQKDLIDSIAAQKYLADANDARSWLAEQQAILSSKDVGQDEDSAESLIKKNKALMQDVEQFGETVTDLHKQAEECRLQCPWEKEEGLQKVLVLHEYREKTPRELSVKKGEVLGLISAYNKDWWKVESGEKTGFVPSACLRHISKDELEDKGDSSDDSDDESASKQPVTLLTKQQELENLYDDLKKSCSARNAVLEHSRRQHALARESDDLLRWIENRKQLVNTYELQGDEDGGLDEVQDLQKKLDEFQKDVKAREKRIAELNEESQDLRTDGTDGISPSSDDVEAPIVADKVQELNAAWGSLHEAVTEQNNKLGSAHQVHGFFRDAEEAHNWIEEKNAVLQNENVASDLSTVQALQRKHEGLERDLVALGEHVFSLDEKASQLYKQFPEQEEAIRSKQSEINKAWNDLVSKAEARKRSLSSCHELQRFLADCKELQLQLRHIDELTSRKEVADDIAGAESLLQRHQDYRADIDALAPSYHHLQRQADALIQADHPSADEIDAAIQETSRCIESLEKSWADRSILLEQCLALHHFLRECEAAESWMEAREAFVSSDQSGDSLNSVESLIKKHEDFDRAISLQEAKIMSIQASSEHLLASDPPHYAADRIQEKADKVAERWKNLKAALIDKRSRLGETQSLQQFRRDADEANAWINEKLQTTLDENYKDPTNIQSKHQKHQAFEAELEANKDRIKAIVEAGKQLIASHQCAGSEDAVQNRIEKLEEDWNDLLNKSHEKGVKLREANQQQDFVMAVKDLELWMAEVEAVLASEDIGKDVRSVSNLLKKQKLLEADVAAHEDRAKELSKEAGFLIEKSSGSDALDPDVVRQKQSAIEERFVTIKDLTKKRRSKLQQSLAIHQLLYDIADEQAWINEKKILISSSDTGKDLTSAHKLKKRHKRMEVEIASHQSNIDRILTSGNEKLKVNFPLNDEVQLRLNELEQNWSELNELSVERRNQLQQAQAYHKFRANLDEECGWMNDQLNLIDASKEPTSLAAAQSSLSKHEAFKTDLNVHKDRLSEVKKSGTALIEEKNPCSEDVSSDLQRVDELMSKLESASSEHWNLLRDLSTFLQFNWKTDVVESWINEKEQLLKSEDFENDLSLVQALLIKQATFYAGLQAFEQEGIANLTSLKDQLLSSDHAQRDAIQRRHALLMEKWEGLKSASKQRKEALEETQSRLRDINDLYLAFAKKASAFNSWFENVEEDMSDPVQCHSVLEIQALIKEHKSFCDTLDDAQSELKELFEIDDQLSRMSPDHESVNPYTWFTRQNLEETWNSMQEMVREREAELQRELGRQEDNDVARKKFAKEANAFHDWLTVTRTSMIAESGSLESQLEAIKLKSKEVKEKNDTMKEIEKLGAALEKALILDNIYTEHSTVGLAQQWDQLEQLGMRMQHNLEQQIQARNMTGVAEDALKEFSMMFKHFDKDKSGRLDHHEFKSCLRSLGYDLPMVEEGEEEPEFEAILDTVDPNRDGFVSLQEYMTFMISRETENVQSSKEVESAFQALSNEGKPYVTKEELYQNLSREQADYCIANMPPYYDSHGISVLGAYDYVAFTRQLFNN